jgi:hypothetical protein
MLNSRTAHIVASQLRFSERRETHGRAATEVAVSTEKDADIMAESLLIGATRTRRFLLVDE